MLLSDLLHLFTTIRWKGKRIKSFEKVSEWVQLGTQPKPCMLSFAEKRDMVPMETMLVRSNLPAFTPVTQPNKLQMDRSLLSTFIAPFSSKLYCNSEPWR